jgi:hypothetical protein
VSVRSIPRHTPWLLALLAVALGAPAPVAAVGVLPLSSASPAVGSVAGGTTVTITGSGFTAGAKVSFGGAAATAVVVVSTTEIVCRTLAHAAGAVTVTVSETGPIRFGNLVNGFAYTSVAANPTPVAQEFPVPTGGGQPFGITAGPDSNLWFTEFSGNQIGRITPAGAITESPIPTANSEPSGIAAGPDGNMWFTEFFGNKIGRITPDGTINETPGGNQPFGIAAGPDGNLWFAEINGNQVGVLVVAPPAIAALSPFSGPANAPTTVTITGSGFAPDAHVSFGGAPVPALVNNPTSITATAPAHGPGTVDVVVTTGGSTATVHGFTYGTPGPAPPARASGSTVGPPVNLPPRGGPTVSGTPDAAPPPRPLFP